MVSLDILECVTYTIVHSSSGTKFGKSGVVVLSTLPFLVRIYSFMQKHLFSTWRMPLCSDCTRKWDPRALAPMELQFSDVHVLLLKYPRHSGYPQGACNPFQARQVIIVFHLLLSGPNHCELKLIYFLQGVRSKYLITPDHWMS